MAMRTTSYLLAAAMLVSSARGATIYYNLTITYGFWSPDCVQKQVILVNGQYPGPTLSGTVGDTLVVNVYNGMDFDSTAIHWHGIRQLNNNLNDGVSHVTQCPIGPKDFFTYKVPLDKDGTFMYHAHLTLQSSAGLYGKLIVYPTAAMKAALPYKYGDELAVILNDWWHRSIYEQVSGLNQIPFQFVGEPQSLLMNGRGVYNCSLIPTGFSAVVGDVKSCNSSSPQCGPEVFLVEQGKTYLFRISSIGSLSSQNLVLEGHTMTVVAADSYMVQNFTVGSEGLDVYSGQTYDVIFTANQPVGNYWVRTGVFGRKPATPFGLAVIRYAGANASLPTTTPPAIRPWDNFTAAFDQLTKYTAVKKGEAPKEQVPPAAYRKYHPRLLILTGAQQLVQGHIRWAVNNISLELPSAPYALGLGLKQSNSYMPSPPDQLANPWNYSAPAPTPAMYGSGYYWFGYKSTNDIVIQNSNNLAAGVSEFHPWHMHGHQFWVLAYGNGQFNPATDTKSFNQVNPAYRNTVAVPPFGWVALRLKADNPGAWFFHCHINSHLHMGMKVVFVDGYVLPLPSTTELCGGLSWPKSGKGSSGRGY